MDTYEIEVIGGNHRRQALMEIAQEGNEKSQAEHYEMATAH